jgi:hypothetical protein
MKQESIISYIENMDALHEGRRLMQIFLVKKRERVSMISGWIGKNFILPMTFTGGCDTDVFNAWLEQILAIYGCCQARK